MNNSTGLAAGKAVNMRIKVILNRIVFCLFGLRFLQRIWDALFGFRWRGCFLGAIRYRAVYHVHTGETVVLGGVFNEEYIEDYANIVGDTGTVVVIEANPENINRLKQRFSFSERIIFVNNAIWSGHGKVRFIVADKDQAQGYNRIQDSGIAEYPDHLVKDTQTIEVPANSIDNILNNLNISTVHQINLTINGAELQALDGVEQILRENPDVRLYINSQAPEPSKKVIARLKQLGFKVYTSKLITTTNKKIKLTRIYAFR